MNQFFLDKAKDRTFLGELKRRSSDHGVKNVLIMIDAEGDLGHADKKTRYQSVENHYKWVEAAKFLGCHSIRVNAAGKGTPEAVQKACAESLHRLSEFAAPHGIGVIVENHGGLSSNGKWLAEVIRQVGLPNCGTLPDFGNFYEYDRYQGVAEMLPFAKGVSAKAMNFSPDGQETKIDYSRMLKLVKNAGYTGHIGIEYEGNIPDEDWGIRQTQALLVRAGQGLS